MVNKIRLRSVADCISHCLCLISSGQDINFDLYPDALKNKPNFILFRINYYTLSNRADLAADLYNKYLDCFNSDTRYYRKDHKQSNLNKRIETFDRWVFSFIYYLKLNCVFRFIRDDNKFIFYNKLVGPYVSRSYELSEYENEYFYSLIPHNLKFLNVQFKSEQDYLTFRPAYLKGSFIKESKEGVFTTYKLINWSPVRKIKTKDNRMYFVGLDLGAKACFYFDINHIDFIDHSFDFLINYYKKFYIKAVYADVNDKEDTRTRFIENSVRGHKNLILNCMQRSLLNAFAICYDRNGENE